MARHWTSEQKAKQSALIHSWQPWTQSTGAKTAQGKAICSQNVNVGKRNKQKALEQAMMELDAALAKVAALTDKRTINHCRIRQIA